MARTYREHLRGATYIWSGAGRAGKSFVRDARTRLRVRNNVAVPLIGDVSIPSSEVRVLSAFLELRLTETYSGTRTFNVRRLGPRKPLRQITWNSEPAVHPSSSVVTVTHNGSSLDVSVDVTADILQAIADDEPIHGWRISTTSDSQMFFRGPESSRPAWRPQIRFTVSSVPSAPTDLAPSTGFVGDSHPPLTFVSAVDFTDLRVQIDEDEGDFSTPIFDSGWVASTTPIFQLAGSGFAGLANNDDRDWRVKVRNDTAESKWSDDARLARAAFGAASISSPADGATVVDGSPPVTSTLTGATSTQRRVRIFDDEGARLWGSGWLPVTTATTTVYPQAGLTKDGQSGRVVVDFRDDKIREAVQGAPAYQSVSHDFTLDLSSASQTVSLAVSSPGPSPWVRLAFSWDQTPDEWRVVADGAVVATALGGEPLLSGTDRVLMDYAARAHRTRAYQVQAVVNGAVAASSPVVEVVPTIRGMWILEVATGADALLLGSEEVGGEYAQTVEKLAPVGGLDPVLVYGGRFGLNPTLSGVIANAYGRFGADELDTLEGFRDAPAGPFRVAWADQNIEAALESVVVSPRRSSTPGRIMGSASVVAQQIGRSG